MKTSEYEKIGEHLCRVAKVFLPNEKNQLQSLTQDISNVLSENHLIENYVNTKTEHSSKFLSEKVYKELIEQTRYAEENVQEESDNDISSSDSEENINMLLNKQNEVPKEEKKQVSVKDSKPIDKKKNNQNTGRNTSFLNKHSHKYISSKSKDKLKDPKPIKFIECETQRKYVNSKQNRRAIIGNNVVCKLDESINVKTDSPLRVRKIITNSNKCSKFGIVTIVQKEMDYNFKSQERSDFNKLAVHFHNKGFQGYKNDVELSLQGVRVRNLAGPKHEIYSRNQNKAFPFGTNSIQNLDRRKLNIKMKEKQGNITVIMEKELKTSIANSRVGSKNCKTREKAADSPERKIHYFNNGCSSYANIRCIKGILNVQKGRKSVAETAKSTHY